MSGFKTKSLRHRISILAVAVSALAMSTYILASSISIANTAAGMGANPAACDNIYLTRFTYMSINNGSMTFDPLANPGLSFRAKDNTGYTISYTLHAANQSLSGNTLNGSAFLTTTALGRFNHDECVSGFGPSVNMSATLAIPSAGFSGADPADSNQSVLWSTWKNPASPVTYNVIWYSGGSNSSQGSTSNSTSSTNTTAIASANQTAAQAGANNQATNVPQAAVATVSNPIVQQGTIASNSTGFASVLAPTDSVYTGTISYTSGSASELYILHAYGISSSQNVSSQYSAPMTINVDGKTYAVSVISSGSGNSGSTVFSGNGLMIHSAGGSFIAVYTLKASVDTPTIVNNFTSALVKTQTAPVNQTSANQTSASNQTSTSSTNQTSTSSSNQTSTGNTTSSSSAQITATAGSTNSTVEVKGTGFSPNVHVTTTINGDSSSATTTTTDSSGAFDSALLIDPASMAGTTLQITTTEPSSGTSATTSYAVP